MFNVEGHRSYENYAEVRQHGENENQRPWDFLKVVGRFTPQKGIALDAGCGTAFKLVELQKKGLTEVVFIAFDNKFYSQAEDNYGLPAPSNLLRKAKEEVSKSPLNDRIHLLAADTLPLGNSGFPFRSECFETVFFMLSVPNPQESFRVLKRGGVVIMEIVGEQDKLNIKRAFGMDGEGNPRGYKMEYAVNTLLPLYQSAFEDAGFSTILHSSGTWETRYTEGQLRVLLKLLGNRFVKDYDEVNDKTTVDNIIIELSYQTGPYTGLIKTHQHRLLYIGQKPL